MGIQEDIERVEQHIREIEQRIERQRGVITQAEESGLPTDGPRNFLWFLKETRSLSRDHLGRLLADEFRAKDSQLRCGSLHPQGLSRKPVSHTMRDSPQVRLLGFPNYNRKGR
ncbi:MAG: hypothetical protein EOS81_26365 [Mesorhizobium sp.]|uniref:hypothetical protein n=1 Tax=unclassified Mesorhizobium TaxID=325217 RepID=UPI000F74F983|nr:MULTISPECIES: hypothetical protein [unclassified Mesorhizobium]RVC66848.1 hypothetical protein EN759_17435 [Mesorhizobium sp. M00.F.Ca.ET.038.03.1.1]RVC79554.1 hypothetical protein EN766_07065 [Mesorhizobium sp. M2A.F.Ca.ET.046.02.1.1]AZO34968.1 hypothetical protein EJ072_11235 [Mesorhizobium sp. M2A.F.Ca.ET.046.03.2.1]RWB49884.1 MAG: hypothetical protein EOQ44_01940 [Mesorhizobium sp.]RWE10941.1 MAG: hypothetical protein EOS76_27345 [Mesorhizobium sp.]